MSPFDSLRWAREGVAAFLRGLRRNRLAELRAGWGKPVARERDLDLLRMYHDLVAEPGTTVDETTWQDLALDEVFAQVDRTCSQAGGQVLYHQMRTYLDDDTRLAERTRQYRLFRQDAALREAIQRALRPLESRRTGWLAPLLVSPLPERPRHAWRWYLLSGLSLACLMGLFVVPSLPLFLAASGLLVINLVINETYGRKVTPHYRGFAQVDHLLTIVRSLAKVSDSHGLPQLEAIRARAPMAAALQKKLGWFARDRSQMGEAGTAIMGLLNLAFLLDILAFLRILEALRQHQPELVDLLEAVGSLDAAISVASYLEGAPCACEPRLVEERRIEATGLCHPLLVEPVGNDLALVDQSALITGSNMAGKTTFIRTVAINVILAQTLHFVLAEKATLPRAIVQSSIRREDHLASGQSYFFAEIARVRTFLDAAEAGPLRLFVIDEIFRGTNTVERIASATAVLRHLGVRHLALVTTHDLELQDLLGEAYAMFHFEEQVLDGGCTFDYRLHPGPARSRNAIRLLGVCGYPEPITREALALADQIARTYGPGPILDPSHLPAGGDKTH